MKNINKIVVLFSVGFILNCCGVIQNNEDYLAIDESESRLELLPEADKSAKIKSLLTLDNQARFDAANKLKQDYKTQIEDICSKNLGVSPYAVRNELKASIEVIKNSDKSKKEKMTEIKALYENQKDSLVLERDNKFRCYYAEKETIGQIMINKKYLKHFCYGKTRKYGHHGSKDKFYKKGKYFSLDYKKKKYDGEKFDEDDFFTQVADILNVTLDSSECKDLLKSDN
jgi:hypothetical protein